MTQTAAPDRSKYRLRLPDEPDHDDALTHEGDVAEFYNEMLDLGRKRSQKVQLFSEMIRDWDTASAYYTFRIWTDHKLVHPDESLDVGTTLVERGVSEAFFDGSLDDLRHAMMDKSVTRYLKNDREQPKASRDISYPPTQATVGEMYATLREVAEAGGEQAVVNIIADQLEEMSHPWIFTYWLNGDLTFYVGQYQIRKAMVERWTTLTSGVAQDAERINCDVPSLFLEYATQGNLRTNLRPHDRMGNMKAKGFDADEVRNEINHDEWVAQTKYDGARIFVHHDGDGDIRAYTTGKRDITKALPELDDLNWPDCAFIFDGEATPYDSESGEVKSFQKILTRIGQSPDEMVEQDDLEVRFKFFDCPYWNGRDIRNQKFEDRYAVVTSQFVPPRVARQGNDIEATFHRSIERGHEGVVLKKLGHTYQPGSRSSDWRKWKADPMEVDVQVTGASEVSGAKQGVGALDIALEYQDRLVDVGSVGTGFTDKDRKRLWRQHEANNLVGTVIQVSFEELQVGVDDTDMDSSWALRFPSFDHIRPDGTVDSLKHAAELDDMEDEFETWNVNQGNGNLFS